jgi:hypothetical protein
MNVQYMFYAKFGSSNQKIMDSLWIQCFSNKKIPLLKMELSVESFNQIL